MFGFFKRSGILNVKAIISDEVVEKDFDVWLTESPSRCAKCSRMHPMNTKFAWVNSACHFHGSVRNYEELKIITQQSYDYSAWCLPCVKSPES